MLDEKTREELEERAKTALSHHKKNRKVPLVVEFAGSPKAGKTTNIDIIEHLFKRIGFKIWAPTEGASKRTPYHLKRDLVAFNCWSLNYAISEILVAYNNVDPHDLVILDRGPFDSLAWMGLLRDRGELKDDEYKVIKNFALHNKWLSCISRIYLFTCRPDVSLERENEVKLISRPGTAMNTNMLTELLQQYENLKEEQTQCPLFPVETSDTTSPLGTALEIANDLIALFSSR
ncbi:MAG: hypothetical protein IIA72_15780 [Proteobacteria bacterium]|nr:hypothetical protein [Pseudomonadota bacterium]